MESRKLMTYTEEDYYKFPDEKKVELIDGQIYDMASPTLTHQRLVSGISNRILNHIELKDGRCEVVNDFDTKLFDAEDTIVRPDISVICDKGKLTERRCEGAPDWIIEVVSQSNASNDYIRKTELYDRAGVREYWIVDPENRTVYVYHYDKQNFHLKHYSFRDKIPAGIYDGFIIDFSEIDDKL